jgi:NAD(P)-dependent dehydrogenase (short-subunit alcohol dehydrogenase family)
MDLGLKGRLALVTGGSRGIGLAIATALAAEGCNLHIAALTKSTIEEAAERLRTTYGVSVTPHAVDLADSTAATPLTERCGDLDILVNNAGAIPKGMFDKVDDGKLRRSWDLKLFGYLNLARPVYVGMRERGRGVIINIIGVAGERPPFDGVAGAAANAALIAFTRALGSESLDHGVRVVAVNPGPTKTERQLKRFKDRAKAELGDENRYLELLGSLRFGEPRHIGDAVAFLASDRAEFISGTTINIDGGLSSRSPLYQGYV